MEKILRRSDVVRTSKGVLMPVIELEDEGHVSPSWTGLNFFYHYRCLPALSLVGACGREIGGAELV